MLLTLESLPAAEGDCLLLHWGSLARPRLALIDGGPAAVWENTLLPRLEQILQHRGLAQLPIELVMVSHVDIDHMAGLRNLFQRLRTEIARDLSARRLVVRRLWYNPFNEVLNDAIDRYYQTLVARLPARLAGAPNPALEAGLIQAYQERYQTSVEEAHGVAHDVALILAGHEEGRELREHHASLHSARQIAALNSPFPSTVHSGLITAEARPAQFPLAGLAITILGPKTREVARLQAEFHAFIDSQGLTVEALLAAFADRSVPNLSSIVCLIEQNSLRILLTGDARGDRILEGLGDGGLLDQRGQLLVDILKVPHHGNSRNVTPDFFKAVIADTYILSGNGNYGNPERRTLEWLISSREQAADYTIALTHSVSDIDARRRQDALQRNAIWIPQRSSLASLFEDRRQQGFEFTLMEGGPGKIDLGNETVPW